jgi:UDP-glucuronate 4-epimerase
MKRDFTYVSDVVDGVLAALDNPFKYEIINLGNNKTVRLNKLIRVIEKLLGKKAKRKLMPIQKGDVPVTYARISKARKLLGYKPEIRIKEGVSKFIEWYKEYNKI